MFDVTKPPQNDPFYVVDCVVDRKSDDAVLAALTAKYPGQRFVRFAASYSGTIMETIDARSVQDSE